MNTIEKIRTEIGKHLDALNKVKHLATFAEEHGYNHGFEDAMRDLLSFLDTLEEDDRPEPYNPVYDEAYLNEKIAKATESWKGVDVDAMLAECRGIEEETQGLDEDIITIHLGKMLPEEQYNEVVRSVVAFMNKRWPGLLSNEFAN